MKNPRERFWNRSLVQELKDNQIDIDKYEKYYDVIDKIDLPIRNKLSIVWSAFDRDDVRMSVEEWEFIERQYEMLDTTDLDNECGRELVEKMKPLVREFGLELRAYYNTLSAEVGNLPPKPDRLEELKNQIMAVASQFEQLPAYRVYRALADRRGFQKLG